MGFKFVLAKALKILLNPPAIKASRIAKTAKVCPRSELSHVTMEDYSYIGSSCFMVNVSIGKFCSIADGVAIGGATHTMDHVSTSPVFNKGKNVLNKNFAQNLPVKTPRTVIENDVWIGMGCFIKAGITVHNGAVIGMGSVVTHDVPAYEIWAGNPAKCIRSRFSSDTCTRLENSKWWNMDIEVLKRLGNSMTDPDSFLVFVEKGEIQ